MSAVDQLFLELRRQGRKALMPFVTAGDPDLDFTVALIQELARRGCHLCEVGFPYSDPIADGPVIQASYARALGRGIKASAIFERLGRVHSTISMPLLAMASFAIVYRHGLQRFVEEATSAGMAGVIVPDLPVEESGALSDLCRRADFSLIQLITPTTPRERAIRIANATTGFIYYVSVTGITGERMELPADLVKNVAWLRGQTELPICVGFGVSSPAQARLLSEVADGIIVGSAIVRRIAEASTAPREKAVHEIGDYAASLLDALEGATRSTTKS
jgi:tryptophan synthase alpha chain